MKSTTVVLENVQGGNGPVIMKHILEGEQLNKACKKYMQVTLPPKSSIGYHKHIDDTEGYYIISGEGEYNDNGKIMVVKTGDSTFTDDGQCHGLENKSNEDLVFIALIQVK